MPPIDQAVVQAHVAAGVNAANPTGKGRALEDLIAYVFGQVPGISNTTRNQMNVFETEEVDVAFFNNAVPDGFPFLPNLLLVEAKNWSKPVSSMEVSWFDNKIRSRGLSLGILIANHGVTGDAAELTAAHQTIAAALREQRRLIVIRTAELVALTETDQLVDLIKTKLCELVLRGTVA